MRSAQGKSEAKRQGTVAEIGSVERPRGRTGGGSATARRDDGRGLAIQLQGDYGSGIPAMLGMTLLSANAVLGHYPDYVEATGELGAARFAVPARRSEMRKRGSPRRRGSRWQVDHGGRRPRDAHGRRKPVRSSVGYARIGLTNGRFPNSCRGRTIEGLTSPKRTEARGDVRGSTVALRTRCSRLTHLVHPPAIGLAAVAGRRLRCEQTVVVEAALAG